MESFGSYDVLVCGAGPAGIGAAVSSAERGAKTLLVEAANSVGGMGTGAGVNMWCDSQGGRIFDELEKRVVSLGRGKRRFNPAGHVNKMGRVHLHGETVKAVALGMIREAGAEVLLGYTAVEARVSEKHVKGTVLASRGGLVSVYAKATVDCTADANIAASAGAEYLKGDPVDGRLMQVTFQFEFDGVDYDKSRSETLPADSLIKLLKDAHSAGRIHPPAGLFTPGAELFPYDISSGTLRLNRWEIEKVDCSDPAAVSRTTAECQAAALQVVEFCRENLPGYEDCGIGKFHEMLGMRESRRIKGRYTLTEDDVLSARKFSDGIAKACFFIDFHDSPPGRTIPYDLEFKRKHSPPAGDYYEIPYRCLLPEKISGLLVAGRCISAERPAMASLRVMPTCMYTGEAAGRAAALSAVKDCLPGELDAGALRTLMGM